MTETTDLTTAPDLGVLDAVDAHHHLWCRDDLEWLSGPMLPRIFGPYEPLRRDYLGEEYAAAMTAAGFAASVYVQANWPLDRSVDEVRWVHAEHERTGWPSAIVGSADLFSPTAPEVFAAQRDASPLLRGTRLQLHWHSNQQYRFASAPDRMLDPQLRCNVGRLAELDWVFELQVFPAQMVDAARLAAEHPAVTFVLAHAGMLESRRPDTVRAWRDGLARLAEQPNVVCKLSAQGTFVHRVDRELIELVTATSLELFGSRRCLFGTNLPVETLWATPAELVDTWLRGLAAYPESVRKDVLSGTARRVYRL